MRTLPSFIVFILFIGCNDTAKKFSHSHKTEVDIFTPFQKDTLIKLYEDFSIILPKGWRFAVNDTFQVLVADATTRHRFHNTKEKLVYWEYGAAWNVPPDKSISKFARLSALTFNIPDTSLYVLIDKPEPAEIHKRAQSGQSIKNISTFPSIYIRPKKIGSGFTAVFVDSIGAIGRNIAGMVFFAENLDSLETVEFEKVSQSIAIGKLR